MSVPNPLLQPPDPTMMRPIARHVLTFSIAAAVCGMLAAVAVACPTCQNALAQNDPVHQSLVAGYFYSILFMMSMPFLLVGTFGSYAYLLVRRSRRDQDDTGDQVAHRDG